MNWCSLSNNELIVQDILFTNSNTCQMYAPQTEDWLTTVGHSFFQFKYSPELSDFTSVGTLTLTDWIFQNFFYDFTSFIGFAGKYSMDTTKFHLYKTNNFSMLM